MSWPDLSQMISIVRLRETESWPGPENNYSLLMLSRLLCGHQLGLELRLELEETLISPTQSWHDTSATLPQSSLPSLPPSLATHRKHLENTKQTMKMCLPFYWSDLITSTQWTDWPESSRLGCQMSEIFQVLSFLFDPGERLVEIRGIFAWRPKNWRL